MKAITADAEFVPHVVNAFDSATQFHHAGRLVLGCLGCEAAAEGAFAIVMRRWEWFVYELLVDLMSGRKTAHRNLTCARVHAHASRSAADSELRRVRYNPYTNAISLKTSPSGYLLLHNPAMVAEVARYWLRDSSVERVFLGYQRDIELVLHLRHGIAHGTAHATQQMRAAMLALDPLHVYMSIGGFLVSRTYDGVTTWLEYLFGSLVQWAVELSP